MAAGVVVEPQVTPNGWISPQAGGAWVNPRILDAAAGSAFDPALMAAIARPWPDIVFSQPRVVASGMTPPDNVPQ